MGSELEGDEISRPLYLCFDVHMKTGLRYETEIENKRPKVTFP